MAQIEESHLDRAEPNLEKETTPALRRLDREDQIQSTTDEACSDFEFPSSLWEIFGGNQTFRVDPGLDNEQVENGGLSPVVPPAVVHGDDDDFGQLFQKLAAELKADLDSADMAFETLVQQRRSVLSADHLCNLAQGVEEDLEGSHLVGGTLLTPIDDEINLGQEVRIRQLETDKLELLRELCLQKAIHSHEKELLEAQFRAQIQELHDRHSYEQQLMSDEKDNSIMELSRVTANMTESCRKVVSLMQAELESLRTQLEKSMATNQEFESQLSYWKEQYDLVEYELMDALDQLDFLGKSCAGHGDHLLNDSEQQNSRGVDELHLGGDEKWNGITHAGPATPRDSNAAQDQLRLEVDGLENKINYENIAFKVDLFRSLKDYFENSARSETQALRDEFERRLEANELDWTRSLARACEFSISAQVDMFRTINKAFEIEKMELHREYSASLEAVRESSVTASVEFIRLLQKRAVSDHEGATLVRRIDQAPETASTTFSFLKILDNRLEEKPLFSTSIGISQCNKVDKSGEAKRVAKDAHNAKVNAVDLTGSAQAVQLSLSKSNDAEQCTIALPYGPSIDQIAETSLEYPSTEDVNNPENGAPVVNRKEVVQRRTCPCDTGSLYKSSHGRSSSGRRQSFLPTSKLPSKLPTFGNRKLSNNGVPTMQGKQPNYHSQTKASLAKCVNGRDTVTAEAIPSRSAYSSQFSTRGSGIDSPAAPVSRSIPSSRATSLTKSSKEVVKNVLMSSWSPTRRNSSVPRHANQHAFTPRFESVAMIRPTSKTASKHLHEKPESGRGMSFKSSRALAVSALEDKDSNGVRNRWKHATDEERRAKDCQNASHKLGMSASGLRTSAKGVPLAKSLTREIAMERGVTKIQAITRAFIARRRRQNEVRSVTKLQAFFKARLLRRTFSLLVIAVRLIQISYRNKKCIRHAAAQRIQRNIRRFLRSRLYRMRRNIVKIQSLARRHQARKRLVEKQLRAVLIQKNWRRIVVHVRYNRHRSGLCKAQRLARTFVERKRNRPVEAAVMHHVFLCTVDTSDFHLVKTGVVRLQAVARGVSVRKFRISLKIVRNAAILLQAQWRMVALQRTFSWKRRSAIKMQKFVRGAEARNHIQLENTQQAVRRLQRYSRNLIRRIVDSSRRNAAAALLIQRVWRGYTIRLDYGLFRLSAVRLQLAYRRFRKRKSKLAQAITSWQQPRPAPKRSPLCSINMPLFHAAKQGAQANVFRENHGEENYSPHADWCGNHRAFISEKSLIFASTVKEISAMRVVDLRNELHKSYAVELKVLRKMRKAELGSLLAELRSNQ